MWPSIFTTFPRPNPTDRLNNPSHSSLENLQSSTIGQVQAFIGNNSSVQGTLLYDVRSPLSNGGGHVQSADKGGTGQTTYTKGDTLVATGTSVLSKLAVGQNNTVYVADSSAPAGVKWANAPGTKVFVNSSLVAYPTGETSIFSVTIPGSTLGTSNAIKATVFLYNNSGIPASIRASFGGNVISSMVYSDHTTGSLLGTIQYTIMANNATNLQRDILQVQLAPNRVAATTVSSIVNWYGMNTSSIESSANATMGMTIQPVSGGDIVTHGVIIERII